MDPITQLGTTTIIERTYTVIKETNYHYLDIFQLLVGRFHQKVFASVPSCSSWPGVVIVALDRISLSYICVS